MQLQQDGIVVVASAGNAFKQYNAPGLSYPAASPYVIPVSSVDSDGSLSDFSQRSDRVIAAPGRQILSTIPDHVLGADGVVNDWSVATGTSMAAPYVAGSAVLIREAMEIAGWTNITPQRIYEVLQNTADSVWDAATNATYDRLNLGAAINFVMPDDDIGGSWDSAQSFQLNATTTTTGFVNTLGDSDAFKFTAALDGAVSVSVLSSWIQDGSWSLMENGQAVSLASPSQAIFNVKAGHTYALAFSDADDVGSFQLNWSYTAKGNGSTGGESPSPSPSPINLGSVHYREAVVENNRAFTLLTSQAGITSIVLNGVATGAGPLELVSSNGQVLQDTTVENGQLRLDVESQAGTTWTVKLPNSTSPQSQLIVANVLSKSGSVVNVQGTDGADTIAVDMSSGIRLQYENIQYQYSSTEASKIRLELGSGQDSVTITGTSLGKQPSSPRKIPWLAMSIRRSNSDRQRTLRLMAEVVRTTFRCSGVLVMIR